MSEEKISGVFTSPESPEVSHLLIPSMEDIEAMSKRLNELVNLWRVAKEREKLEPSTALSLVTPLSVEKAA